MFLQIYRPTRFFLFIIQDGIGVVEFYILFYILFIFWRETLAASCVLLFTRKDQTEILMTEKLLISTQVSLYH